MAIYIVFDVDVKDPERYAKNRDLIQPTLEPSGESCCSLAVSSVASVKAAYPAS